MNSVPQNNSVSNDIARFEEIAIRHNAALAAFRSMYEAKCPPPARNLLKRQSVFVPLALFIIMVASVIVSGSRTITEFGGNLPGVAAFIMIEGAIIAYAFFRARRNVSSSRLEDTRKLASFGLIFAVVVALSANIHAVLKERGVKTADTVNLIINVFVAISAPALAVISGDVLALELSANDIRQRNADEAYERSLSDWNTGLTDAWARERGHWGVKVEFSTPKPSNGIPLENPMEKQAAVLPSGSTLGHRKAPNATLKVIEYLTEHPEAIETNPLELAAQLNVGKSTVYAVLKGFKNGS